MLSGWNPEMSIADRADPVFLEHGIGGEAARAARAGDIEIVGRQVGEIFAVVGWTLSGGHGSAFGKRRAESPRILRCYASRLLAST